MSKNCLWTRLRAVVNDPDLEVLEIDDGTLNINVTQSSEALVPATQQRFRIAVTEPVTLSTTGNYMALVDGSGNVGSYTNTLTIPASQNTTIQVMNVTCVINVDKAEALRLFYLPTNASQHSIISVRLGSLSAATALSELRLSFSASSGDIASLADCTGLEYLALDACSGITGDVASLASLNPDHAYINQTGVTGDISAFSGWTNIEVLLFYNTALGGNIVSMGSLTSLMYTGFDGIATSKCSGSVEEFVAAQIAAGRTTCSLGSTNAETLRIITLLHNFTFGGSKILSGTTLYYTAVTWESASKIAVFAGTGSNVADLTHVYAKGYTQQEASQKWPEYTVTIVG